MKQEFCGCPIDNKQQGNLLQNKLFINFLLQLKSECSIFTNVASNDSLLALTRRVTQEAEGDGLLNR
jgi:hypothetical protein